MVSEKSLRTGHFVRSKPNASNMGVGGQASNAVHYVSKIEPNKLLQVACLRVGRFVEHTADPRVAIMREDNRNEKLMRISEYRTLTTCKFCVSGKVGNGQR